VKFLLDQDVYGVTAKFFKESGYDFIRVADIGLSQASDEEILKIAQEQNRVLITRDRDYGNLVFVKSLGAGVIYLRMLPTNLNKVHIELIRVLETYSKQELSKAFVVVECNGHRLRKPTV
jgi:predicted nuclease of predicted toxin-antitoxin system